MILVETQSWVGLGFLALRTRNSPKSVEGLQESLGIKCYDWALNGSYWAKKWPDGGIITCFRALTVYHWGIITVYWAIIEVEWGIRVGLWGFKGFFKRPMND
ncbi:hypothetical protein [Tenuibacillus multivorans]|uniref:Uncharacterized protein n=1 Tax=Tenuibacillus multivorans TaxID=237069 RepID=A0A1H0A4M8_9BACI|nr:hypothetical protein [Tenuibacillus multivorans]GEL78367.1 hypothetical protein TMU01_26020 [Tenuibacillus multivorans]SDN27686.1 hypothetical protein SAMN05216498_1931 [Tenuibacillus multivorans]